MGFFLTCAMRTSDILRPCCVRGAKCASGRLWTTFSASTSNPFYAPKALRNKKRALAYSTFSTSRYGQPPRKAKDETSEEDSAYPPRLPLPGNPIGTIRACLNEHKNKKWGLLIYRCDYNSDDNWAKFMDMVESFMQDPLEIHEATDLLPSLEMTVMQNQNTLDGASVDQIRELFKSWVLGDEAKSELRDALCKGPFAYPRYTYCVHVDADALDSVVNRAPWPPHRDREKIGYVHLVRLRSENMFFECPSETEEPDDEEYDEDEGDENMVKIPDDLLGPGTFAELFNTSTFGRMQRCGRKGNGVTLY